MGLVVRCYSLTREFPSAERFGLVSQINRAAVSIISNIAEGYSRSSPKELCRFLEISPGSCFELETQLLIAESVGIAAHENIDELLLVFESEQRMLQRLIFRIENRMGYCRLPLNSRIYTSSQN